MSFIGENSSLLQNNQNKSVNLVESESKCFKDQKNTFLNFNAQPNESYNNKPFDFNFGYDNGIDTSYQYIQNSFNSPMRSTFDIRTPQPEQCHNSRASSQMQNFVYNSPINKIETQTGKHL